MAPGHTGKRSRMVCRRCHEKKVRCDLQVASNGTQGRCNPCVSADAECEFRPSNKGRRRKPQSKSVVEQASQNGNLRPCEAAIRTSFPSDSAKAGGIEASHEFSNRHHHDGDHLGGIDDISPTLQQGNLETYWEYIYSWCPVIDPGPDAATEPILQHVLALLAGSISPPFIPHADPRQHYRRARHLFEATDGADALMRVKAALLLSCSSAGPPNVGSMDNAFWWIGMTIRLAQDIGLHREPPPGTSKEAAGLRRRIWWALYARERIIAICQGQPCIIDEDYTDVRDPDVEDFPSTYSRHAIIFTQWVSLCETIGFVNKQIFISRRTGNSLPTHDIASRLTRWLRALPPALRLPISTDRAAPFDRDVHLLHLPYLMTIASVYLNTTQRLPEACVAAVIAGACITRVFEDFLARGVIRFVLGQGSWYIAGAALALRPLRSLDFLSAHAAAQISLLSIALKQLVPISHSAKMIEAGLERLLSAEEFEHSLRPPLQGHDRASNPARGRPSTLNDLCAGDGVLWSEFFPFVTVQTSPLLEAILTECQSSFPELWPEVDLNEFNDFLEEFSDIPFDWSSSSVLT